LYEAILNGYDFTPSQGYVFKTAKVLAGYSQVLTDLKNQAR